MDLLCCTWMDRSRNVEFHRVEEEMFKLSKHGRMAEYKDEIQTKNMLVFTRHEQNHYVQHVELNLIFIVT